MSKVQGAAYYCRGCGDLLPEGSSAHFHPECLKADKRRRVAERRQGETQRFQAVLRRLQCPECGANLGKLASDNPQCTVKAACEGSRGVETNAQCRCRRNRQ